MHKICYIVTIPTTIKAFFIPQLQYLAKNGFDVSVICNIDYDIQTLLGDEIHFYPMDIPRGYSIKGSFTTILKMFKIFQKEKFSLIQYSTPNASLYAAISGYLSAMPIRNYHLMGFRYLGMNGISRYFLKTIEKITCKLSTNIECVSYSNLELGIQEKLFPNSKVSVIWNGSSGGIDLLKFDFSKRDMWRREIRNQLHIPLDKFVFGYVGRITRDKGINELLSSFFALSEKYCCKLLLIGILDNVKSLNSELLENAKKCENILFHPLVYDIEKYYAAVDVLVLPSYREGFGNVIIEAGAMGTPAIASDIPGPRDAIINGITGLLVPPKSTQELVNAMTQLLHESPATYRTFSYNAFYYAAKKFDNRVLCEKIVEHKKNILHLENHNGTIN